MILFYTLFHQERSFFLRVSKPFTFVVITPRLRFSRDYILHGIPSVGFLPFFGGFLSRSYYFANLCVLVARNPIYAIDTAASGSEWFVIERERISSGKNESKARNEFFFSPRDASPFSR